MMDEFGLQMPTLPMRLFSLYEKFGYFLVLFSLVSIVWIILFALRLRDWQWQPWKAVYPRRPAAVRLRALLALAIGAGHSVVATIETLARFQGAFAIRSRLIAARERIQSGDEPWSATELPQWLRLVVDRSRGVSERTEPTPEETPLDLRVRAAVGRWRTPMAEEAGQ